MNLFKIIFKTLLVLLLCGLLFVSCKSKKDPVRNRPLEPDAPATTGEGTTEEEPENLEDPQGIIFKADNVEAKNSLAKEVLLATALKVDVAQRAKVLNKIIDRRLTAPAAMEEAYPLAVYAYEVYLLSHTGENSFTSDGEYTLIPTTDFKDMIKRAFNDPSLAESLPYALMDTDYYNKAGEQFKLSSKSILSKYPLESFTMEIDKNLPTLTFKLTPEGNNPALENLEWVRYQFHQGSDNNYRLEIAEQKLEKEDIEEVKGAVDITDKLEQDNRDPLKIVGSVGSTTVASDYWDGIFSLVTLDLRFNETKRVTFEFGQPKIDFRNNQIFLKFPTHVVVLDSNLEIKFYEEIPKFMQDYVNAFTSPTMEKNTQRNLEFYSYDLSNDFNSYLYSSGYGAFIYDTTTEKQQKIFDSEVKTSGGDQYLYSAFEVKYTPDNRYAYGYLGSTTGEYVQYEVATRTVTFLGRSQVSSTALSVSNSQMGSFFNPAVEGLEAIGSNYYVAAEKKTDEGAAYSIGLLASPGNFEPRAPLGEDVIFSALLDDGRMIYTRQTDGEIETFYTHSPSITSTALTPPTTDPNTEGTVTPEAESVPVPEIQEEPAYQGKNKPIIVSGS